MTVITAGPPTTRRTVHTLALGAALLAASCAHPAASPGPARSDHEPRIARIERSLIPAVRVSGREYPPATIEEQMAALGIAAVSVAVIEDGAIAWARAWGVADAATGAPATPETLFQAASMSKPVAAMAALTLVQDGRLTLDDDVNRWLTRWQVPAHQWAAEHPVTLRRLLSHTAGLTVHGFPGYAAGAPLPTIEQVLSGTPPANTDPVVVSIRPGETSLYSGGGTTVVQLLVEEVTGRPFAEYLRERVLEPVGMKSSTYEQPLPAAHAERAATGHRSGLRPIEGRWHTYPEQAAAGLWTTPTELAYWILSVQRSMAGSTAEVLSPATAHEMLEAPHGLGPHIEGDGDKLRFLHGGANEGFRGVFAGFAHSGRGVVVMTNSDTGSEIALGVILAIAREYGWPGLTHQEIIPEPLAADALPAYAGRYGTAADPLQLLVEVDGADLILIIPDGTRAELIPVGPDRFLTLPGATPVDFARDATGAVTVLTVQGLRLPRS